METRLTRPRGESFLNKGRKRTFVHDKATGTRLCTLRRCGRREDAIRGREGKETREGKVQREALSEMTKATQRVLHTKQQPLLTSLDISWRRRFLSRGAAPEERVIFFRLADKHTRQQRQWRRQRQRFTTITTTTTTILPPALSLPGFSRLFFRSIPSPFISGRPFDMSNLVETKHERSAAGVFFLSSEYMNAPKTSPTRKRTSSSAETAWKTTELNRKEEREKEREKWRTKRAR